MGLMLLSIVVEGFLPTVTRFCHITDTVERGGKFLCIHYMFVAQMKEPGYKLETKNGYI